MHRRRAGVDLVYTGHHWFPTLAIFGFDTAIDAPNAPVGQHADNCHFGDVQIQNCNRAIHLQNPQANHWRFDFLQCSFTVETVLEIDGAPPVGAPGDISFGMLHLDSIALVFKINQRSSHNPGLTVDPLVMSQLVRRLAADRAPIPVRCN